MLAIKSLVSRFARNQTGNVALAAAFSLPVLIMVVGGAVDIHQADVVRTRLRDSLDAATLAAARNGTTEVGQAVMRAHMDGDAKVASWTANFTKPEQGRYRGEAEAKVPAFFLAIIGTPRLTVSAQAEALVDGRKPAPCLTLLSPNASQALLVNSGAKVIAPQCEIHVNSTAQNAAIFNSGSRLDAQRVCVKSTSIIDNGGRPAGLETGCQAQGDPYPNLPTPPTRACDKSNSPINGGTVQFTPGVYCGGLNFNGKVNANFAPGLYVIRGGDWNVNGGVWRGEGVTFYFEDTSRIQFNSGIDARLSAPKGGQYDGVLFFEKPGLPQSNFIFNDSAGNVLDGVMHLPSRNVTYNSGSSATGDRLAMVFNTLIINQAEWRLAPVGGGGSGAPRLVR